LDIERGIADQFEISKNAVDLRLVVTLYPAFSLLANAVATSLIIYKAWYASNYGFRSYH